MKKSTISSFENYKINNQEQILGGDPVTMMTETSWTDINGQFHVAHSIDRLSTGSGGLEVHEVEFSAVEDGTMYC